MKFIPPTPGPWFTDAGRQVNDAGLHLAYIQDAPGLGHAAVANEAVRDVSICLLRFVQDLIENEAENIEPHRLAKAKALIARTQRPYPKSVKQSEIIG